MILYSYLLGFLQQGFIQASNAKRLMKELIFFFKVLNGPSGWVILGTDGRRYESLLKSLFSDWLVVAMGSYFTKDIQKWVATEYRIANYHFILKKND